MDRALLSAELLGEDVTVANGLPLAAVLISAMLDFLRGKPGRVPLIMPNQLLMISRTPFLRPFERLLL